MERQEAFERELSQPVNTPLTGRPASGGAGKGKERPRFGGIQDKLLERHALQGAASRRSQCFGGRDGLRGRVPGAG